MIFIADCGKDEEGVESWIIIASILGGLILLTLIVLVIIKIIIELRVSNSVIICTYV